MLSPVSVGVARLYEDHQPKRTSVDELPALEATLPPTMLAPRCNRCGYLKSDHYKLTGQWDFAISLVCPTSVYDGL